MFWKTLLLAGLLGLSLPWRGWAACTPAELATEFTSDPMSLGYAAPLAAGNHAALQTLLNVVREPPEYRVSKGVVSTVQARGTWGDIIFNIQVHPNVDIRRIWGEAVANLFVPYSSIDYANASTAQFFASMVQAGLLKGDGTQPITTDDVTARTTRQGSRAEVLCGANVTLSQISFALDGNP